MLVTTDTRADATRTAWRFAAFDVDRTLLPGSSLRRLALALLNEGFVTRRAIAAELARERGFARRGASDATVDGLRARLLRLAAGRDHAELASVARRVGRDLVADVYPAARWLVDRHLEAGHFCVLVSASPQELVEGLALALEVHRAVGTRVGVEGGRLTGVLDGPLCYAAGKLDRVRSELGPVDFARAVAYADSLSDLPLLEACGRPVAVNPDAKLRRVAQRYGWPVLRFG